METLIGSALIFFTLLLVTYGSRKRVAKNTTVKSPAKN